LIFGNLGFPALGIRGAAIATVISQYARVMIYFFLVMQSKYREKYLTLKGWKPEKELLTRLLRFGFPNGLHYSLELVGYTILLLLIGRLGTAPLAATNITFNINHLVFLPLMGFGMAVSILVGKRLGEDQPQTAQRTTWSTIHMSSVFIGIIAALYLFFSGILLYPYAVNADPREFTPIAILTRQLLKIVAIYILFDMANIIFAAAIKGAGDTRFVMTVSVLLSWSLSIIPAFIAIVVYKSSLFVVWGFHALYITALGIIFLVRFLGGKWKSMRVIEREPPPSDLIPGEVIEQATV
jgi:MATE family multidrug resistance protein